MTLKKLSDAIPDVMINIAGATMLAKSGSARAIFDFAFSDMQKRLKVRGVLSTEYLRARGEKSLERGLEICESPIERSILAVLICGDYGEQMDAPLQVHIANEGIMPDENIVLVPQLVITKYRLDFALIAKVNGGFKITAVECDGAKYHKENHIIRDGYLASWGIKTFHFSGKQIHRDPFIANQVCQYIRYVSQANG